MTFKNGYYRFTSERASYKSIAQYINGDWYLIGEENPVTLEEINRRGWEVEGMVENMDPFPDDEDKSTETESTPTSIEISYPDGYDVTLDRLTNGWYQDLPVAYEKSIVLGGGRVLFPIENPDKQIAILREYVIDITNRAYRAGQQAGKEEIRKAIFE